MQDVTSYIRLRSILMTLIFVQYHQDNYLMCVSVTKINIRFPESLKMTDSAYIHPSSMIGLCNPTNQLGQLVCMVLRSIVLAAGAHGYFQALSTEHCMALRDAVIGQRLDHVRCAVVQDNHTPGDGTRQSV